MPILTYTLNKSNETIVFDSAYKKKTMTSIIENSKVLLSKMSLGYKYTYRELQKICDFTESQLCFAILYLLREGKISQYRESDVVYELISM